MTAAARPAAAVAAGYPPLDLPLRLPCIMGILNITPDSFSDGGRFLALEDAVEQARRMVAEGAAIIDLGGESTRPGSEPVPVEEELDRVLPVLEAVRRERLPALFSVDTMKAEVARRALDAGAALINDQSALRYDPGMAPLLAERGCAVCLMHMQGRPKTMQDDPRYDDVVGEVKAFLRERLEYARAAGIRTENVLLDPGIGFGKTAAHNLVLLRHLGELTRLERPILLGASRKRFLGSLLDAGPEDRAVATAAVTTLGVAAGVAVFRVHDVLPNMQAMRVALAVRDADEHRGGTA